MLQSVKQVSSLYKIAFICGLIVVNCVNEVTSVEFYAEKRRLQTANILIYFLYIYIYVYIYNIVINIYPVYYNIYSSV